MSVLSLNNINISVKGRPLICDSKIEINEGDVVLLSGKNGSGKSTIIKTIMGDIGDNRDICAKANLSLNSMNIDTSKLREIFNQRVCYISQEDIFEANRIIDCCLTSITVVDGISNREKYIFDLVLKYRMFSICFSSEENPSLKLTDFLARRILKKVGISIDNANFDEIKASLFLAKNPHNLSGGQKKMVNIFCNLVRYEYSDVCIIDEPLNALDFNNVRLFSNFLTSIHKNKPQMCFLIVTHCRSIPCITRFLNIENQSIVESFEKTTCYNCFGEINEEGYYVL